jgi:DNA repair protein RecO (recombination protein O)
MLISTNAIVLSKLKYNDNDLIVRCYTQQLGVVSFLLRGVLKSKKSNTKAAYFQPLSQLQLIIDYKSNRTLHTIKETKLNHHYLSLYTHVLKSAIVMFLSEVLSSTLKEEEQNETLFSYLETTLLWLDEQSEYSNFHLLFLLNLSKYLGFYPETNQFNNLYFDLAEGNFTDYRNVNTVQGENLVQFKKLFGINFDALHKVDFTALNRQSILSILIQYFELHLAGFKKPKSLAVLKSVFN